LSEKAEILLRPRERIFVNWKQNIALAIPNVIDRNITCNIPVYVNTWLFTHRKSKRNQLQLLFFPNLSTVFVSNSQVFISSKTRCAGLEVWRKSGVKADPGRMDTVLLSTNIPGLPGRIPSTT